MKVRLCDIFFLMDCVKTYEIRYRMMVENYHGKQTHLANVMIILLRCQPSALSECFDRENVRMSLIF